MTWTEYLPDGNDYVPIEKWGKDHWSTLAYLECRTVDQHGIVNNKNMRCNPRIHREFMNSARQHSGKKYPTILKSGEKLEQHDDWSCVEDMVAAGLIRAYFDTDHCTFGGGKAKVELTADGHAYTNALRRHKSNGGTWADFDLSEFTLVRHRGDNRVIAADLVHKLDWEA